MKTSWYQIIESGNQIWIGNDYTVYSITTNVDTNMTLRIGSIQSIQCRICVDYDTYNWQHLGLELKSIYELRFLLAFEACGYHT